jgi:hypothetical protein
MSSIFIPSSHPYLFFNCDGAGSVTFFGFNIDPKSGDSLHPVSKTVLQPEIMSKRLQASLRNRHYNIQLNENFEKLSR